MSSNDVLPVEYPKFNEHGVLEIPAGTTVFCDLDPELSAREWQVLLFIRADKTKLDSWMLKQVTRKYCGSRPTKSRAVASLKRKGYL